MENDKQNNIQMEESDFFDGKHLIFKLNEKCYGIPIVFVSEIIGLMDITPVPRSPEFLKGVINLRGKIIPVLDLRKKLGMQGKEDDEQTCIIIVDIQNSEKSGFVGLVVDMVSEVYKIPNSEIEANLQYGLSEGNNFLTGIGKIKETVVMLLNVEAIVNFEAIKTIVNQNAQVSSR